MDPRRVAAIDCGTNSIRLLVADVSPADGTADGAAAGPRLVDVDRRLEVVRLGEGVEATGELSPAALERTLAATARYAEVIGRLGASRVRFVATSASRDARNAADLVEGVRALLGVAPEVISGEEEARLSFAGALAGLAGSVEPQLVVDLGGGSTEFVLGDARGVRAARSVDMGCVRFTERHLHGDPPTSGEIDAARADARALIARAGERVPLDHAATLVGVAGTVTTITAHALALRSYDAAAIDGARLGVDAVLAAAQDLLTSTRARRAALPFMHPGRVDVIGAGALIWQEVVRAVAAASGVPDVVTSEHDILDGVALALAAT